MKQIAVIVAVFFATVPPLHAQPFPVPITDDAPSDPSFEVFRNHLLDAVVERDIDRIISIAHPNIQLDFGGGSGHALLRERLENYRAEPDYSAHYDPVSQSEELWLGLESALRLGANYSADDQTFTIPYLFTVDLPDRFETFTTDYVIGTNVTVRDRPNRYGRVIDRLDHAVVSRLSGGHGTSYRRVDLGDGRSGWVHKDLLRSLVDYRAIFEKDENENWQMLYLIAGD